MQHYDKRLSFRRLILIFLQIDQNKFCKKYYSHIISSNYSYQLSFYVIQLKKKDFETFP